MDKNVSIVKVDKRSYRAIARDNWGLTREQMKGMHVHHRIPRSKGGTNDPTNLYVCSPWFHDVVWHGSSGGFIGLASEGARKAKEMGVGVHARSTEQRILHGSKGGLKAFDMKIGLFGRTPEKHSQDSRKAVESTNAKKDAAGRSMNAVKGAETLHQKKDSRGKSVEGVKSANRMNSQVWESLRDGFRSNAGAVANHNRARGWDPNARIRLS
jgi:hypothetical protein